MTLFEQAVTREAKLRLVISGPSGSGKTYTSLAVATAPADGGREALVDTEHGSASNYANIYDFDVFLDMGIENNAIVNKTRCPSLNGQVFEKPGADLAEILREWLRSNSDDGD